MVDTTNLSFKRPTVGGSEDVWGGELNENWEKLDTILWGASFTDATANTVERIRPDLEQGSWQINGTTITPTAAQFNYLTGTTSAIQTQLTTLSSGKQPLDTGLTSIA